MEGYRDHPSDIGGVGRERGKGENEIKSWIATKKTQTSRNEEGEKRRRENKDAQIKKKNSARLRESESSVE